MKKPYNIGMFAGLLSLIFFLTLNFQYAYGQKKKEVPPGYFTSVDEALKSPEKVQILDLHKQKLTEVPEEVLLFPNMTQLLLQNNKITELPDFIGKLNKITFLNVSKNKLTSLPNSISKMTQLNSINISQNKIKELPDAFFMLKSIEILELYSNPLAFDPEKFSKIGKQIKFINIQNTLLSNKDCETLFNVLPNAKIKCSRKCNCQK